VAIVRLFDTIVAWLMRPKIRRARRWSFVATLPLGALIALWGFALGPRAYPHRIGARTVVLRAGPMYRVSVPRGAIVAATARRERVPDERGLVERDGEVLLPVRGRVDVLLELATPSASSARCTSRYSRRGWRSPATTPTC